MFRTTVKRAYSTVAPTSGKRVSILDLRQKFKENKPITMVTAYDYPTAQIVEKAGIDMILVGDSLGMVVLGYDSTVPVNMEESLHHCRAVARGASRPFLVGDMPFGSYEVSPAEAARNAMRFLKDGNMHAVKLEGGQNMAPQIRAVVQAGVPCLGHIGLTPQKISALGGFRVQGKSAKQAQELVEDALRLQDAGAFAIVVESVPHGVAEYLTSQLEIPTIGIGAGPFTSGQVLVLHDMVGLYSNFTPKFCKRYADVSSVMTAAVQQYVLDVTSRRFPSLKYSYTCKPEVVEQAFPGFTLTPLLPEKAEKPLLPSTGAEEAPPKAAKTNTPAPEQKEAPPVFWRSDMQISDQFLRASKKINIAVVGAGAMGCLVAGRLATHPLHNVWMLSSWAEHVEKIQRVGLRLDNLDRTCEIITTLNATTDAQEMLRESGAADIVIVLVKGPFTAMAARKAALLADPTKGIVLTLQNGVGNRETLERELRSLGCNCDVVQGVMSHASLMLGEGHAKHTGIGPTTLAVEPEYSQQVRERVLQVASCLSNAGITTSVSADLEGMVWGKLVINAGINPLSALFRVRNGILAENVVCRSLLTQTVEEAAAVAQRKGVRLPFRDAASSALEVAQNTALNMSSMLCDVIRGVTTEIQQINGVIVREGDRLGVPVDVNRSLIHVLESGKQFACLT